MKNLLPAIVATIVFAAGDAMAADMPLKAPRPPAPVYSWTGCYFGGNVGGIWERDTASIGLSDPVPNATGLTGLVATGTIPVSFRYNRNSWLAGGQLGCNYQFTSWIVGIETDFDSTRLNGEQTLSPLVPPFIRYTSTVTQSTSWLGTTRGRIGAAWDNVLLYATGGVAYAKVSNTYFLSDVPSGGILFAVGADSATQVGWTVGGGLELGFGSWSVKGEALWYDLGNHTLTAPCALTYAPTCSTPNAAFLPSYQNRGVVARLGLNYRFGHAPLARY
jgi:outer membrane immunogenic protein